MSIWLGCHDVPCQTHLCHDTSIYQHIVASLLGTYATTYMVVSLLCGTRGCGLVPTQPGMWLVHLRLNSFGCLVDIIMWVSVSADLFNDSHAYWTSIACWTSSPVPHPSHPPPPVPPYLFSCKPTSQARGQNWHENWKSRDAVIGG